MSLPGIAANKPGRRERTFSPLGCNLSAHQRVYQVLLEDKQEAETGIGEPLGPLIDNGIETELLEEYGESWAGYTAAYDNYFDHTVMGYGLVCSPGLGRRGKNESVEVSFYWGW